MRPFVAAWGSSLPCITSARLGSTASSLTNSSRSDLVSWKMSCAGCAAHGSISSASTRCTTALRVEMWRGALSASRWTTDIATLCSGPIQSSRSTRCRSQFTSPPAFPIGWESWWLALEAVVARNKRIQLLVDGKEQAFECETIADKRHLFAQLYGWVRELQD